MSLGFFGGVETLRHLQKKALFLLLGENPVVKDFCSLDSEKTTEASGTKETWTKVSEANKTIRKSHEA